MLLERLDPIADHRGGEPECPPGRREAAGLGRTHEDADALQHDHPAPPPWAILRKIRKLTRNSGRIQAEARRYDHGAKSEDIRRGELRLGVREPAAALAPH